MTMDPYQSIECISACTIRTMKDMGSLNLPLYYVAGGNHVIGVEREYK